jgi:hypothetical protein
LHSLSRLNGSTAPPFQPRPGLINLLAGEGFKPAGLVGQDSGGIVRKQGLSLIKGIPDPFGDFRVMPEVEPLGRGNA